MEAGLEEIFVEAMTQFLPSTSPRLSRRERRPNGVQRWPKQARSHRLSKKEPSVGTKRRSCSTK